MSVHVHVAPLKLFVTIVYHALCVTIACIGRTIVLKGFT